jgi:dTDP-glucose 4,6-dehydratase
VEKLIPSMIIRALNDQMLPLYGEGINIRDWLHVYDHCSALALVLDHGKNGEVYNIGGNNERTNLYVVKRILRELGKPETLIEYVEDRPGHDLRYAIDSTKMKKMFCWEPLIRFEDGLGDTIRWFLNNQDWWNDMAGVLRDE